MMTNEELFYLLQKFYPGTINGTHYLTGHRLDTEGNQLGEAFLQFWHLPDPQPTRGQLLTMWEQNRIEIQDTIAGIHHRWERAERLLKADALVYRAEDASDEAKAAAARKYRQALRDVPQQAGFPRSFEWPEPPEDDEVQNVAKRDVVLAALQDRAAKPMPVASMPDDLLPIVTRLNVNRDGTTGPALPDAPEPMYQYGNLETGKVMMPPPLEKPSPIVPVLNRVRDGPVPDDDDDSGDDVLPHSPGYGEAIPPDEGISDSTIPPVETPPFVPSPQPPLEAIGQPDVHAAIAVTDDPVTKLRLFLAANPDVVTYIDDNTPPPDPEPDPEQSA